MTASETPERPLTSEESDRLWEEHRRAVARQQRDREELAAKEQRDRQRDEEAARRQGNH